jgi:hypothetical protein
MLDRAIAAVRADKSKALAVSSDIRNWTVST